MDNFRERGFTVAEAELPARLGLSRELLRTLREQLLTKGRHWEKAHRDILLTEEAVQIILDGHAALKNAAPLPTPPPTENLAQNETQAAPPVDKGPVPIELRVARLFLSNPHLVEAHPPGRPQERLRVRVQSSAHYVPGMILYATHLERNLWQVHGRAPRWRGERLYRQD